MTDSSPAAADLTRLARRCEWLVWAGSAIAILGPVFVWLLPDSTPRALFGLYGLADPAEVLPLRLRLIGAGVSIIPGAILSWGLLGMVGAFRSFRAGAFFGPAIPGAVRRLGRALVGLAVVDPVVRLIARVLAGAEFLPSHMGATLGFGTRAIVFLVVGATLLALAAVMREANRLADENASFV